MSRRLRHPVAPGTKSWTEHTAISSRSLESFACLSYEQFVIDVEIWNMTASLLRGFPVDEEWLALPLIRKVGHEGHFMGEKATVDAMRKGWKPRLTDVTPFASWVSAGSKDIHQRAHEEADRIFVTHRPEPLAQSTVDEIQGILKEK